MALVEAVSMVDERSFAGLGGLFYLGPDAAALYGVAAG